MTADRQPDPVRKALRAYIETAAEANRREELVPKPPKPAANYITEADLFMGYRGLRRPPVEEADDGA